MAQVPSSSLEAQQHGGAELHLVGDRRWHWYFWESLGQEISELYFNFSWNHCQLLLHPLVPEHHLIVQLALLEVLLLVVCPEGQGPPIPCVGADDNTCWTT